MQEKIRAAGYNPYVENTKLDGLLNLFSEDYVRWYHLRAYDRINGPYKSFIKQMEEKTGILFHQAQVALARKWIGKIDEAEVWVQDTGELVSAMSDVLFKASLSRYQGPDCYKGRYHRRRKCKQDAGHQVSGD